MSSFPSIKLTYFPATTRAEHVRLAFHIGGMPFVNEHVSHADFRSLKESFPFGELPILEVDGHVFAQSQAILRYAGRLAKLYPVNDLIATLKVNEILCDVDEMHAKMNPSYREQDAEKKKAMRSELAETTLPRYLAVIEARLATCNKYTSLQTKDVLIHDVAIYAFVKMLRAGYIDHIPVTVADGYLLIEQSFQKVASHPKVQECSSSPTSLADPQVPGPLGQAHGTALERPVRDRREAHGRRPGDRRAAERPQERPHGRRAGDGRGPVLQPAQDPRARARPPKGRRVGAAENYNEQTCASIPKSHASIPAAIQAFRQPRKPRNTLGAAEMTRADMRKHSQEPRKHSGSHESQETRWVSCAAVWLLRLCIHASVLFTFKFDEDQHNTQQKTKMSVYPAITLKYFSHGGLAEAIRLAFFIGEVPFVDERLTEEQFAALKPSLPYGQVPVLEIGEDKVVVAQSQALLRYAGRLAKLFPVNNPLAALKIDEILNALDELRIQMAASFTEEDEAKKKAMREELAHVVIPHYLAMLEPRLEQLKASPGYESKTRVYIHEIVVYLLLKQFRMGVLDYIPATIADPFPLFCAVFDKLYEHPKVKEWYALAQGLPPKLTLTYVDQAGRAEPIRLAFFIGGVEFEDERISHEEFGIRKGLLPFHQLPVLQVDSEFLAQTFPILRYAGTLSGGELYPANDPLHTVRVDEILSALDEFDNLHTQPLIRETDQARKVELARKLTEKSIPELLRFLDKRIEVSGGPYACGETLTVADLAIFSMVSFLNSQASSGDMPISVIDPFDNLKHVYNQVISHPKVAEWYKTHTR